MTVDVKLITDSSGAYDVDIGQNGDLVISDDMSTALTVSLFSDARTTAEQISQPEKRRGWLGDNASPVQDRLYGSTLWLLEQKRLLQSTLNDAVNSVNLALNWMIEDGILQDVSVTGSISGTSGIVLEITLTTLSGQTDTIFVPLWRQTVQNIGN